MRKGRFTREEWKEIFRRVARYCKEHKHEEGGYRACVTKYLRRASETGKVPV